MEKRLTVSYFLKPCFCQLNWQVDVFRNDGKNTRIQIFLSMIYLN